MTVTIERKDSAILVQGPLDISSVAQALEQIEPLMSGGGRQTVDLSGVERIDSAGLAFLVELLRRAKRVDVSLEFRNVPAHMKAISSVYGLGAVLPDRVFRGSDTKLA